MANNLKEKVSTVVTNFRAYWKIPPVGRYMPYKEIAALSGGGVGIKFIVTALQATMLSVGNVFIGNVIGIEPDIIYILYVISILASFPLTMVRARMIDNSRNKKGKYRPYILSMAVPTAILAIGYYWFPYDSVSDIKKYLAVLFFNIGFQFFYNFLYDAYDNFIVVLSPNTIERSDVSAIKAVADSLAPSIMNLIIPILAGKIIGTTELVDIRVYKYLYPPFMVLGVLLAIIIYVNTQEKIVQARTHVIQVKFIDALKAVAKNKYFWIIALAGWIGFLEGSYGNILAWMQSYQHACSPAMMGIINTINGNAALWGMILSPFMIKHYGKKKVLIVTNMFNVLFLALLFPVIHYMSPQAGIWLVLGCLFMNGVVGSFAHILNPSLNGDIRDYQQYITGERIDGMFAAVGLIGSTVTLITSGALPAIYKSAGLNADHLEYLRNNPVSQEIADKLANSTNVYDVLYDPESFKRIMSVLILASVVGAALNVIPYFFYDLTEMKQKGMVAVLKLRALFEDYGNDALHDSEIVEVIDMLKEADEYYDKESLDPKKAMYKGKYGQARKEAKAAYFEAIEHDEKIFVAKMLMDELHKFERDDVQDQLIIAKQIRKSGLENLHIFSDDILEKAKALPKETKEEKEFRKQSIDSAKRRFESRKNILKYYPDGLVKYDRAIFDDLFAEADKLDEELTKAHKSLLEAKENKNDTDIKYANENLKTIRAKISANKKATKKATDDFAIYNRCAKPYLDAKKLMIEEENYKHYDEIAARYEESKVRAEAARQAQIDELKRLEDEKNEKARQLKDEKKLEKLAKKDEKLSKKDEKISKKEKKDSVRDDFAETTSGKGKKK